MKLKSKIGARCKGYSKKETEKRKKDGLMANVEYRIPVTPAQAKKIFGPEFAEFCFSDTIVDGDTVIHRFANKTPGSYFRPEKHAVVVDGVEVICKPKLTSVVPTDGSNKVVVKMILPVYVGPDSGLGPALDRGGEDVELAFTETQQDLPFEESGDEGED